MFFFFKKRTKLISGCMILKVDKIDSLPTMVADSSLNLLGGARGSLVSILIKKCF